MSILSPPPILPPAIQPQAAEVRYLWEETEAGIPQGAEGQQIRERLEWIISHWGQRSSTDLAIDEEERLERLSEEELLEKLNDYLLPPLEFAGTRQVCYDGIVDLLPPRISIDLDEIEQ